MAEGVFSSEFRTVQAGQRYIISIFVNEFRIEPSLRGRIQITTDDPEMPVRELRLYAQFGDVPQKPAVTPGVRPGNPAAIQQGNLTKPGEKEGTPRILQQPPQKQAKPGSGS